MSALGVAAIAGAGASAFVSAYVATTGGARPDDGAGPLGGILDRVRDLPSVERARGRRDLERRRSECLRDMPVLLDVVTLGLSAGLSFDASLDLYCQRYHTELSRAFGEAMLRWRIGETPRDQALEELGEELRIEAVRRFSTVVSESLAFGTPLAEALEHQAQVIRDEQRSEVEEEIERVPVRMLVPLGTLIVPAMLLAILGPLLGSAMVLG